MTEDDAKQKRRRRRRRTGRKPDTAAAASSGRNRTRSYILIGMPGSGKSSLGRRIARQLNWDFLDTDNVLAEREGMTVGELSQKLTKEDFMKREEAAVMSVRARPAIIATGGSVVYSHRSMRHLQRLGPVIHLDVSHRALERRIGDTIVKRGVILKEGQSIQDLYFERRKLYRRYADITFQSLRFSPGKSARVLAGLIRFLEGIEADHQE